MEVDVFGKKKRQPTKRHVDKYYYLRIPVTTMQKGKVIRIVDENRRTIKIADKPEELDLPVTESHYVVAILTESLDRPPGDEHFYNLPPIGEYKDTGIYLHTWLHPDIYNEINKWRAVWNTSVRKAAHRIFLNQMLIEDGDFL